MTIKDDTVFRFFLLKKGSTRDPKDCNYFPFIENEYSWREIKDTGHPLYNFVLQVLKEERKHIISEAEIEANKIVLEEN